MRIPVYTSDAIPEDTIFVGYPPRLIQRRWDNPDMPQPIEISSRRTDEGVEFTCTIRGRLEKRNDF
jgi:hypothetical protein